MKVDDNVEIVVHQTNGGTKRSLPKKVVGVKVQTIYAEENEKELYWSWAPQSPNHVGATVLAIDIGKPYDLKPLAKKTKIAQKLLS